ncbi:MAG: hypothetical protein QOH89_2302, partial [Pseudonocardiales bacterium]|nr:hypothetical protein [Pseudonocardiales bacterium]
PKAQPGVVPEPAAPQPPSPGPGARFGPQGGTSGPPYGGGQA